MLFRTVYGAELPAIYAVIAQAYTISKHTLYETMMGARWQSASTQAIDDALSFLQSAYLISLQGDTISLRPNRHELPFHFALFGRMVQLQNDEIPPHHHLDPYYFTLLDQLFILPDQLYIENLHDTINQLPFITNIGGMTEEKTRSWVRVLASLGLGNRLNRGFQVVYTPDILDTLLTFWSQDDGLLDQFIAYATQYLPMLNKDRDIAQAIQIPLLHLQQNGIIDLIHQPDNPANAYFGTHRYQQIIYHGENG